MKGSNNEKSSKNSPIVIEFNLSKVILILIAIIVCISAIMTVKVIKSEQDKPTINSMANDENNEILEESEEDNTIIANLNNEEENSNLNKDVQQTNEVTTQENIDLQQEKAGPINIAHIKINSETVSLQDSGKSKITLTSAFDSKEIDSENLQVEWIKESTDGGDVEVKNYGENLYVYGKSIGTVNLKAKVTYNSTTIESNTITINIKKELDDVYQKVTLFKYDPEELYRMGGSVTDTSKQGIYFQNGNVIGDSIRIPLSDWNSYNSFAPNKAYTGLVENSLDENGNIVFTKPDNGIFDESITQGKEIYQNVGLPFKSLGNGKYEFISSEIEVNFGGQTPQSNVNLISSDTKNTYSGTYSGFFPFNYRDGEEAVYHFGMHAQIPFYMTEDGKTNIGESEDIVFDFSGDDDVWIFIDGKLVIDLGGIHKEIAANINFATGEVTTYSGLKSTNKIAKIEDLTDILGEDWNNNLEEQHTLDVFYLERGAGGSNCSITYNMPKEVQTSKVVVHHYIDGTTDKVREDEIIKENVGELYVTSPSEIKYIPPMYEVVEEKLPDNAMGIVELTNEDVIYYYSLKEQSKITKTGTEEITSLTQPVEYNIVYDAAIKDYPGIAIVQIVDKLPYKIDEAKSNLANGVYDVNAQTITWRGLYDANTDILTWDNEKAGENEGVEVLPSGNIKITKNISIVYKDIPLTEGTVLENQIEGTLETKKGFDETTGDTFETKTDFKTKIEIEKVWLGDFEEDRPETITVKLLANGQEQDTRTLDKNNSWKASFENLNKYDDERNEIKYTIEEVVPDGYFISNEEITDIEKGQKYVLTNFKYGELQITKVAEEDNSITLEGTEFELYKNISHTNLDGELIDRNNFATNWELVNTYTAGSDGIINLTDLDKSFEYRLVETKAANGRILPEGQWKIEFVYGDYDENDDTIKNINGTLVRISKIGSTPNFVITDDGNLLLQNRSYYELPKSGGSGNTSFYIIGIVVAILGTIVLIGNRYYASKNYLKIKNLK